MSEHLEFIVPQEEKGKRIDKFLSERIEQLSRTQIQEYIQSGFITSPHNQLTRNLKVVPNLVIHVEIPDKEGVDLTPWDANLSVLFEDEHLIAVNKPAGMVVHPGSNTDNHTLVHALLHHCGEKNLSPIGAPERPGIVHRLDKETSGVIICAKSSTAHHKLTTMFAQRNLYKEYVALVTDRPTLQSGSCKEPIERHPYHRTRMAVVPHGKPAHTDWTLLASGKKVSLLRCVIHTGRTHQIRVHLSHLGHPIIGDSIYGFHAHSIPPEIVPERVMLHAHRLSFVHPITEEPLYLRSAPHTDFQAITQRCEIKDLDALLSANEKNLPKF